MKAYKLTGVLFFILAAFQIAFSQEVSKNILNPAKKIISFGVVADIQYADVEKKGNRDYRNTLSKLEKGVKEFSNNNLGFVINLGDMIDNDYISYEKPLAILDNLKTRLYNVVGNHDFEVNDQYKYQIRKRIKNKNGYFSFEANNMVFIILDGSDLSTFGSVKGSKQYNIGMAKFEEIKTEGRNNAYTWNGGIGDRQLKWLGKLLDKADDSDKKVVIFCHWPLLPENGTQLWNNREVLKVINNHPSVVAWIAGHHHAGGYKKNGNIHYLILKGMVEAKSETSFGIIDVYADKMLLSGYRDQNDQTMEISR